MIQTILEREWRVIKWRSLPQLR